MSNYSWPSPAHAFGSQAYGSDALGSIEELRSGGISFYS